MNPVEKRISELNREKKREKVSKRFVCSTIVLLGLTFLLGRGVAYFAHKEGKEEVISENQETTTVEENRLLDGDGNQYCIIVDAGHGGKDPGKVGEDGTLEKDVNLSIATKLTSALQEKGIQVIMTRTGDEALCLDTDKNQKMTDLNNRIQLIEENAPTFVISIHQNSYTDNGVKGAQVFYLQADPEGKKLASYVQDSLNEQIAFEKPRQIKGNGSYYLLKKSPAITAIVECGFLSNPEECQLLTKDSYQERLVEAIVNGIMNYLGFTE